MSEGRATDVGGRRVPKWLTPLPELGDDETRKRFKKFLVKETYLRKEFDPNGGEPIALPFNNTDFENFLIYEGTIYPVGARVDGVHHSANRRDFVDFTVDATGVQTEGICASAHFRVPITEFTPRMLRDVAWCRLFDQDYRPKNSTLAKIFDPKYIRKVKWWYDNNHDEE